MAENNRPQLDPLLRDTLRDLRSAVDRLQDGQDSMRDRLDVVHARLEQKVDLAIGPLAQRVGALEQDREIFKAEVKREARTWGAAGGITAVLASALALVVKTFKQ